MTNGEKIKEIFPNINIYEHGSTYSINNEYNFNASWWNAEYKEPITKNDLAVDCISRTEVLKLMADNWHTHNGDWAMQESMDDIRALPSVSIHNSSKCSDKCIDKDKLISDCEKMSFDMEFFQ